MCGIWKLELLELWTMSHPWKSSFLVDLHYLFTKGSKEEILQPRIFLCCYRSVLVISKCNVDYTHTFIKLSVCQWTWVWWFLLILCLVDNQAHELSFTWHHKICLLILCPLFYYDPFDRKGMGCVKERKSIVRPKVCTQGVHRYFLQATVK